MNYQSQYSNQLNPYQNVQSGQQVPPTEYVPPVAPYPYPMYAMPVPVAQSNGKAVAGLILGIIGMIAWLLPLVGLPISITGLVLSNKAMKGFTQLGMAKAGRILSIIALVLTAINMIAGVMMAMH